MSPTTRCVVLSLTEEASSELILTALSRRESINFKGRLHLTGTTLKAPGITKMGFASPRRSTAATAWIRGWGLIDTSFPVHGPSTAQHPLFHLPAGCSYVRFSIWGASWCEGIGGHFTTGDPQHNLLVVRITAPRRPPVCPLVVRQANQRLKSRCACRSTANISRSCTNHSSLKLLFSKGTRPSEPLNQFRLRETDEGKVPAHLTATTPRSHAVGSPPTPRTPCPLKFAMIAVPAYQRGTPGKAQPWPRWAPAGILN